MIFKFNSLFKKYIFSIWSLFKKSEVPNKKLFFIFLLTIFGSLLEAVFILLLAPFTNAVINITKVQNNNIDLISKVINSPFILLLLIIFTLFAKSSIVTYGAYYCTKVITLIRKRIRLKLVSTVVEGSWKEGLGSGKLLDAYLVSSSNAALTVAYLNEFLTYFFYVLAIVITLLFNLSIDLIFIFTFLGVFYYVVVYFLSKKAKDLSYLNLDTNQKLSQLTTEIIRGARELQIFRFEQIIFNKLIIQENKLIKNESSITFLNKFPSLLPSIVITLVIIYGYLTRGTNEISSSSSFIVTSLVAVQRLGNYLSVVGNKLTMIGTGSAEIDFILKQLNQDNSESGKKIEISNNKQNSISINKLTFKYKNNRELLSNLNLEFCSGRVSIIAGPSGSGKSTLLSLILKECEPIEGNIKINGILLNEISKKSFYSNLSFVSQSPFIFGTSILSNIKIGKIDASYQEIIKASKDSGSYDFINRLPDKFQFEVSDGGKNLSGGQCQMISLTRSVLKDSPIVFLDEPSNNLDKESIKRLKEIFLLWAEQNKLVIVITHDQRLIDERFDIYNIENYNLIKK